MGNYLTNQDVQDRVDDATLKELTSETGTTIVTALIDKIILECEGEIDGLLATRYATPIDLTTHTELVATMRGYAWNLVRYRLFSLRPPVRQSYVTDYNETLEALLKLSRGEAFLPAASLPVGPTAHREATLECTDENATPDNLWTVM